MCTMYIKIVPGDTGTSEGCPQVEPTTIQNGIIKSVGNVTTLQHGLILSSLTR